MISISREDLVRVLKACQPDDPIGTDVSKWVAGLNELNDEDMEGMPATFVRARGVLMMPVPYATYGSFRSERVDTVAPLVELLMDFYGASTLSVALFIDEIAKDEDLVHEPIFLFD